MKKLTLFTLLSFLPSLGFAFGVTWEGQITDNVDTPVNTHMSGATTTIRFSIWDDTGSVCELYQEEHNVDLTATNGFVSVEIGTGTPTGGSPAFSEAIFSNANNPITGVAACTYNPTALVGRKMDITLDPNSAGVGAEVFATQIDISLLPAAVYAKEASQANTIVANGVTTASILDGTITSVDLSAGAVDSAAILDGTITNADMAVDSITSAEILDGTITFADVDSSFQSALTTGTTAQYFRGDLSLATLDTLAVPENTNLYFTDARALNATLTGFTSGPGAITAADTILSAIQKLDGNSGGGGEVNTASNSGIGGVGVYVIKTGANLEFRNINAGASGTITVTDDSANSEIDLEVTASSIDSSHIVDASIQGLDIGTQQLNELHFQGVPGACTAGQGLASDGAGNFSCTNLGDFSTTGGTMTGNIDMGVNSIQNMNTIEGALGAVGFPTYTFTGDLDTGIYSPAIDNLGFVTAGLERISISPTGEVGIGTGTPAASLHVMGGWPIFESNSNDNIGSGLVLEKSRSAASVQMDDELGSIEWKGHDGTTPITGAYIQAEVDGAVSGGQMPTRMVFNTRDYGGVLDTRMSIMPDGQVYAGAMKADTNAPAAGFGCTFMSTDACQCNFDYTFIDYDQNGMINTDECVEPGLIVDPLESTKVNGFLTVGLEVNYDGAQSTQCAPGFTWYDDDNSGTVNAAA
ncbi:MAG: hypothetical protein KC478_11295, partial [Bacteriovoracaceae bacterium]|nr:hypothetical protein [Bacteriovoracaceae bacterium]